MYGWAGVDLAVDLSAGRVTRTEADPKLNQSYLGGRGVGTKMLWDRGSHQKIRAQDYCLSRHRPSESLLSVLCVQRCLPHSICDGLSSQPVDSPNSFGVQGKGFEKQNDLGLCLLLGLRHALPE
jgi:hypothetical protein